MNEELLQAMQDYFTSKEPEIFYLSHYQIAQITDNPVKDSTLWKTFLTTPAISDYITQDLRLLQQIEIRKLLKDISSKSGQVGTGQTLSALLKANETTNKKEGDTYVYCYIPLTDEELKAKNISIIEEDPFRTGA